MLLLPLILSIALAIMSSSAQLLITTVPRTSNSNGDVHHTSYVPAAVHSSLSIQCTVFNNNIHYSTLWFIKRPLVDSTMTLIILSNGAIVTPAGGLSDSVVITGDSIANTAATYCTNFTVLNFTALLDRAEVQCGTYSVRRRFKLGFEVKPLILQHGENDSIYHVNEGKDIKVTLTVATSNGLSPPFPPDVSYKWFYNGMKLVNNTSIINGVAIMVAMETVNYNYTITFYNVSRSMSGVYTLALENAVGTVNGSITLDILFGPEVIELPVSPVSVISGGTAILRAYSPIIRGNPLPVVSWTGPDGLPRTEANPRVNVSVPGTIVLTNVTLESDNGTYTCWIYNGSRSRRNYHTRNVDLIVIVPASAPLYISCTNITSSSINIHYDPPTSFGIPHFTFYQITLIPYLPHLPPDDNTTVTSSTVSSITTNTTVSLAGLIPYTTYSITIVCITIVQSGIYNGSNGLWVEGEYSNVTTAMTLTGAPGINEASVAPLMNGSIEFHWIIQPSCSSANINISCYPSRKGRALDGRSSDIVEWSRQYTVSNAKGAGLLTGAAVLGPVKAMEVYSCQIVVANENGLATWTNHHIRSDYGLPSTPIIIDAIISPGKISLTVVISYAGTPKPSLCQLLIELTSSADQDTSSQSNVQHWYNSTSNDQRAIFNAAVVLAKQTGNTGYKLVLRGKNEFGFSVNSVSIEIEGLSQSGHQAPQTNNNSIKVTNGASQLAISRSEVMYLMIVIISAILLLILIVMATVAVMKVAINYKKRRVQPPNMPRPNNDIIHRPSVNGSSSTLPVSTSHDVASGLYEVVDHRTSSCSGRLSSQIAESSLDIDTLKDNIAYSDIHLYAKLD